MEAADRNHVDVARVLTEHYSTEVDSTEIPTLVSSNSSDNGNMPLYHNSIHPRMKHFCLLWRKDTQRLFKSFTDMELTLLQSQRLAS